MNEEELKQKETELNDREASLNERENSLNEREETLNEKESDTQALVKQVKDEYEAKVVKITNKYEARLNEREKVIKQLLSDGDANKPKLTLIDVINARRSAQNKKW